MYSLQVRRLDNRDVLVSFERGCSRECTPGCQTMLYRTLCVTCCESNYCNAKSDTPRNTCTCIVLAISALLAFFVTR